MAKKPKQNQEQEQEQEKQEKTPKDFKSVLLQTFNKEYPLAPLEIMSQCDLAEIPGWITTGNYALNWIISKSIFKGLPMGRIVALSGDPSSGKSMIALSMMREPSIDSIIYFDTEGGGVTKQFAQFLGIDPDKILYSTVDTIEELIHKMQTVIDIIEKNKTKKNILMIIDSISMITTDREKDPKGGCYIGDTLINILRDSLSINIPIADIKKGDKVLTHLGRYKEVEKKHVFNSSEKPDLIRINTENESINLTPNHELLIERDSEEIWVEAKNLKLTDKLLRII